MVPAYTDPDKNKANGLHVITVDDTPNAVFHPPITVSEGPIASLHGGGSGVHRNQ